MNPKHVTFNYQAEAEQTNSPHYHATKVPRHHFENIVSRSISVLSHLDDVKKSVFYGRDLPQSVIDNFSIEQKQDQMFEPESKAMTVPLVHSIIGIATEAGELLEIFDKPEFDRTNFIEEIGDVLWYIAIGLNAIGSTIEEAQRINIAKLRKRYPEKFTEYDANNRDLKAERDVLENFHPEEYSNAFLKGMTDCKQGLNDFQCPYPPTLDLNSPYGDWHKGYNYAASLKSPQMLPAFGHTYEWEAGRKANSVGIARLAPMNMNEKRSEDWYAGWDHNERMTKEGKSAVVRCNREEVIETFEVGESRVEIKKVSISDPNKSFEIDGHRLNFQQAQTYITLKQTRKLGELLDGYQLPL